MLLVNTYISNSEIHGLGLFAKYDIEKGSQIWTFNPLTTQVYWKKQFVKICERLPLPFLQELLNYSYIRDNIVHTINDNARFINHSEQPNIAFQSSKSIIALKKISKGEEIVENYLISYDPDDFFFLKSLPSQSKENLIRNLKSHILSSLRVKSKFNI